MENAKGHVLKYGDNVDTDVIIPARYLNSSDPAELALHCMEDIDKDFSKRMKKGDIGLIGLAVMGENLIMNMESKGFTVACYNRTTSKVDAFVNGRAKGKNIIGCHTIQELADSLEKP